MPTSRNGGMIDDGGRCWLDPVEAKAVEQGVDVAWVGERVRWKRL